MAKTSAGLVEYAKAQLGKPYFYGTYGKAASKSYYESKKKQYPDDYKWNYESKYDGIKVHDCVGLIKGYLWCNDVNDTAPKYNSAQDRSANGMRSACTVKGDISNMPDVPGLLVFMHGHVGVYVGNGEVVEAKGHAYGVVCTRLQDRKWETWGQCPYIEYSDEIKTEGDTVEIAMNVLRKGDKGAQVKTLQRLLMAAGYALPKYKDDGDFGAETLAAVKEFQASNKLTVDGIVGKNTWCKLLGVS